MKQYTLLLLFLVSISLNAQTPSYLEVLEQFKVHFNASNSQAAFELMDAKMQKKLTFEKVEEVITTFRKNLGEIKSFEYQKSEGILETYLTEFDDGLQNIIVALNKQGEITGLRFMPANDDTPAKIERNSTSLILPFKGEWFTVWGGDTKAQNYHVISRNQKNAFDFLMLGKNNKTYVRSGTRNEDYYAFGQPLYAVCDAEVITVIEGVEDNRPTQMNPAQPTGNTVVLKTANEEYIVYAHFEKSTIVVKEGQFVKQGQFLGNCGNSGNSTEAHLHLHIQDGPNLSTSIGVKCYFDQVKVGDEIKTDYSPVRLDRIARPD